MPDIGIAPTLEFHPLIPLNYIAVMAGLSPEQLARRVDQLDREGDRLADTDREASDEANEGSLYAACRLLDLTPTTLADSVAMLLAIGDELRGAVDHEDNRVQSMDAWLAFGRVLKSLANLAGVDPEELGARRLANSLNGPDRHLHARWWVDSVLAENGVFIVDGSASCVGHYLPRSDEPQAAARLRHIQAEEANLDRLAMASYVQQRVTSDFTHLTVGQTMRGRRWTLSRPNGGAYGDKVTLISGPPVPPAAGAAA